MCLCVAAPVAALSVGCEKIGQRLVVMISNQDKVKAKELFFVRGKASFERLQDGFERGCPKLVRLVYLSRVVFYYGKNFEMEFFLVGKTQAELNLSAAAVINNKVHYFVGNRLKACLVRDCPI